MGKPKPPERRTKIPVGTSLEDEPDYRVSLEEPRGSAPAMSPGDEVDRALAVLHDRHPAALRVERETQKALQAKKAAADTRVGVARAAARRRWLRGAATVLVLSSVLGALWIEYVQRRDRARAIEASLGSALAPYLARGFVRVPGSRFGDSSLALDVAESSCFVAAGSAQPGDGSVHIERGGGPLDGTGTVGWCTCGTETATVAMVHGAGGVGVVRASIGEVGGLYGFLLRDPVPSTLPPIDDCAETVLDGWTGTGSFPAKDDILDDDLRATLRRAGFAVAGSAPAGTSFAVVPGEKEACTLAWSTSPTDRITLRAAGGSRPVTEAIGAVGVCTKGTAPFTFWRVGSGELVAERVAAGRIGGSHGLRRITPRLGLSSAVVWVSPDDLDWDASSTLRASGILPTEITSPADGLVVKRSRVVALSLSSATATPEAGAASGAAYLCEPSLSGSPATGSSVCVESRPLVWRTGGPGKAGTAAAEFPFWMGSLADVTESRALAAELALLRLGRRIVTDGFELATSDGVTEEEGGPKVVGLGGRDGIVAVQLATEAPWISPCTNGETWSLDGDPAVVSLAAGATVRLKCTPGARRDHRTIVFRHLVGGRRFIKD